MSTAAFQAITVTGGVFPPSLLGRIQAGQVSEASLKPSSFNLAGSETLRDAASRSWGYLGGAWRAWRDGDAKRLTGVGTGEARQKWLLVLLRELGYGQVQPTPGGLATGDAQYPVSHRWEHVAIHLLGPGVDLDRKNKGVEGAARAPQAMLQEFLNREEEYLWAILSNGLRLRLLRDSTSLAGSAYVEFDLEEIFDNDLYSEFQLLWQVCHQSRLAKRGGPEQSPADCWLEAWRNESVEEGTRVLEKLGRGVEKALGTLGTGLLQHPDNEWLREALTSRQLTDREFHKALLRLVYRLLFCFVVEDRGALLDPEASADARRRYTDYFSTARLRRVSRTRDGGPHPDLWRTQKLVLTALGGNGLAPIAVPALGGLFDPDSRAPRLDGQPGDDLVLAAEMSNMHLLKAVRHLSWFGDDSNRYQPVDYRHLGAEELGSVYESLLELIPRVDLEARDYSVERVGGNDRKVTGSYYTPPSLVSALLDTALDPVLDQAVASGDNPEEQESNLLALTVCDPASGSGGFLVAAARRIARRLAEVRALGDEPTPQAVQHALHDVVEGCIYGVDLNDLAAELAKVSLWLEAMEPGKPLGFLDARIKVGNSLMGTTPALLAAGVPDEAFKELEGDDKKRASAVRKRNKAENSAKARGSFRSLGQEVLSLGDVEHTVQGLIEQRHRLLRPVSSADDARRLAAEYAAFDHSGELERRRLHADAWTAAFVWPLRDDEPEPPTTSIVRQIGDAGASAGFGATVAKVRELADDYRFFHWHLEFPEVFGDPDSDDVSAEGWPGGFSCVLGNPPWERVKLQEQEFFAARDPEIATAPNAAARGRLIKKLETDFPELHTEFLAARRRAEGLSLMLRLSGRYPLNGRGDVNTYAVFAELFRSLTGPKGRAGIIVPTGIATDATTQYFFKDLVETSTIAALYDFENRAPLFHGVDSRFKFCLLTMAGRLTREEAASFAFFLHDPADIGAKEFELTPDEIKLINPNTGTLPIFRTRRDAEITLGIYRRVPVLINENDPVNGNPWGVSFMRMFDMSNDSHLFHTRDELEAEGWELKGNIFERTINGKTDKMLPLYEAKMIHQFDHRWATYDGTQVRDVTQLEKQNPNFSALPRYWVCACDVGPRLKAIGSPRWVMGWRDVARATDARTTIASSIPAVGAGDKILYMNNASQPLVLLGILNSFVFDYVSRQKNGGSAMKYFTMKQLPALTPRFFDLPTPWAPEMSIREWVTIRVLTLTNTAYDIDFSEESDVPYFEWSTRDRTLIRAEIDAAMFHAFGIDRADAKYILESFTIIKRKDEAQFGAFRTMNLILDAYDKMSTAMQNRNVLTSVSLEGN
jgi:hypothetical protein